MDNRLSENLYLGRTRSATKRLKEFIDQTPQKAHGDIIQEESSDEEDFVTAPTDSIVTNKSLNMATLNSNHSNSSQGLEVNSPMTDVNVSTFQPVTPGGDNSPYNTQVHLSNPRNAMSPLPVRLEGKPKFLFNGKKKLDKFEDEWLRCLGQTNWRNSYQQVEKFRGFLSGSAKTWWDSMDDIDKRKIKNGEDAIAALREEFGTSIVTSIIGYVSGKRHKKGESEIKYFRRIRELVARWERRNKAIDRSQEKEICILIVRNLRKSSKVRKALTSTGLHALPITLNTLNSKIRGI